MKKRIIFMIINMNIGGTEKALINMITEMQRDKYDITVLMLEKYGDLFEHLPEDINIEYVKGYMNIKDLLAIPPLQVSLNLVNQRKFKKAFLLIYYYLLSKILNNRNIYFKYLLHDYPIINKTYDIAVAYAGPMEFISYFVLEKIIAKQKIQWIHFDVTKIDFNEKYALKLYKKFNKIYVSSNEGKTKLVSSLPTLSNKVESFINIVSKDLVVNLATNEKGFQDNYEGIRILTVGRLSKEKGQDLAIKVLAKLKDAGYKVRWYCIGEGNARNEYQELIEKLELENDFILLGAMTNPYPYMKDCDIYIQPSRHEGYCITLAEAKCFNNPIISTNFTGAREQLTHLKNGIIIDFDKNQMFEAIKLIMENEKLKIKLKTNLTNIKIDNKQEISERIRLFDDI